MTVGIPTGGYTYNSEKGYNEWTDYDQPQNTSPIAGGYNNGGLQQGGYNGGGINPGGMYSGGADNPDAYTSGVGTPEPDFGGGQAPGGVPVQNGPLSGPTVGTQPLVNAYQPANVGTGDPLPQYGLSGFESAITSGLGASKNALGAGARLAQSSMQTGLENTQNILAAGGTAATKQINQGYDRSKQDLNNQFNLGASDMRGSNAAAQKLMQDNYASGRGQLQKGIDAVNPFAENGIAASQRQAALSGALGPEAQAQAFNTFNESPGQAYLREQAEKSLTRNASAIGGLGGGRVRQELQRQAVGLAQQDYQNQFANLGSLSDRGLNAANTQANLRGESGRMFAEEGINRGNLANNLGINLATQRQQLGNNLANLSTRSSENVANIIGGVASGSAAAESGTAAALANLYNGTGQNMSNLYGGAATQIAGARQQAGRDIAQAIDGTASSLSSLVNQQGSGLAGLIGQDAANIMNLMQSGAELTAAQQTTLATALNNLSTGTATNVGDLQVGAGRADAAGIYGGAKAVETGLGNLGTMFGDG